MASREEVRGFLDKFRQAAGKPEHLILLRKHHGSKNVECLLELGITEEMAKSEIFKLQIEDYSSGPEPDKDRPDQEIWKFCRKVNGREIYIKLVLTAQNRAKILSFHFPEFQMKRPLAK